MSCRPRVTEWIITIQTHLPHLTKPQATVLALWSLGMVLARSCALTAVSAFLATWLHRKEDTVRQQWREFCYEAPAKRGTARQALVVETCFVPLLAWVVAQWEGTQWALALDSRGLEILKALPDTPARAQSELRLLTRLRLALAATQGYAAPDLAQVNARMRILCQQVEEPTIFLGALGGLWAFYLARAEVHTAHELAEQTLTLAQRARRPESAIWSRAPVSPRRPFLIGRGLWPERAD